MDPHSPDPVLDRLPFIVRSLIAEGIIPETMTVVPGRVDFTLGLGVGVSIRLPLVQPESPAPEGLAPEESSALELVILGALRVAGKPLKGEALAHRCDRSCSGPFRKVLAQLRKHGQIQLGEDGYILTPISPEATP